MAAIEQQYTATVVFDYVWRVSETTQKLTYTTHDVNTPGLHTVYAVVVNTALPSSLQVETIGVPYTMTPSGGVFTPTVPATVATHMPTASTSPLSLASTTAAPELSSLGGRQPAIQVEAAHSAPCVMMQDTHLTYSYMALFVIFCAASFLSYFRRTRRDRPVWLEEDRDGKMGP